MESKWHQLVCEMIFNLLRGAFGDSVLLAWDQFLYWDARDPRQNAGPDVCGRCGQKDRIFDSWKTWELGVPEFVFEVISESSWPQDVLDKPAVYDRLGVRELVVFDPEPGRRRSKAGVEPKALRAWRRIEGALVEVAVEPERYFMETLGLWVRVVDADEGRLWLRLAKDEQGEDLVPTPEEAERRARAAAEQDREAERRAREAAERDLAAARAEIERLKGGR